MVGNAAARLAVKETTLPGNGAADSAVKTIGLAGEFTVAGGKVFGDFLTAGTGSMPDRPRRPAMYSSPAPREKTPATYVVLGSVTLGAIALTTGNLESVPDEPQITGGSAGSAGRRGAICAGAFATGR